MKKWIAIIVALLLLVGMSACGDDGVNDKENGNNSGHAASKAISANDLLNALKKAGYSAAKNGNVTAEDMEICDTTAFSAIDFYKESGNTQEMGTVYFFQFADEETAVSNYNVLLQLVREDGLPFQNINGTNGLKAVYVDDEDPEYGCKYIISQVENTMIYAMESWDIDGSGSYDDGLAEILNHLCY